MATAATPNVANSTVRGLLSLPPELLAIIISYLVEDDAALELPSLSADFIRNRVPMANDFDLNRPTQTNIYVERSRRCDGIWASALRDTCTQMRNVVNVQLESIRPKLEARERLKNGRQRALEAKADDPDTNNPQTDISLSEDEDDGEQDGKPVLDLIFVPSVGLFPTWLTHPWSSPRERGVIVNIRVLQPEEGLFPPAWIAAAQHRSAGGGSCGLERTCWSLMTVFLLFATGSLDFTRPVIHGRLESLSPASKSPATCCHATLGPNPRYNVDDATWSIHHEPGRDYGSMEMSNYLDSDLEIDEPMESISVEGGSGEEPQCPPCRASSYIQEQALPVLVGVKKGCCSDPFSGGDHYVKIIPECEIQAFVDTTCSIRHLSRLTDAVTRLIPKIRGPCGEPP